MVRRASYVRKDVEMCYATTALNRYEGMRSASAALLNLSVWLDDYNGTKPRSTQLWERVGKVGEENGEVIAAMIGWGGQNPRKGHTHGSNDVEKELFDVAITALGAIISIHDNNPSFDVLEALKQKIMEVDDRRRSIKGSSVPVDRQYDY